MIYIFSDFLRLNYARLSDFLSYNELSKNQMLQRCAGQIDYNLLQSLKELVFEKIGKTIKGGLYLQ